MYFMFLIEEYIVIKTNKYSIDKLRIKTGLLHYVRNDVPFSYLVFYTENSIYINIYQRLSILFWIDTCDSLSRKSGLKSLGIFGVLFITYSFFYEVFSYRLIEFFV